MGYRGRTADLPCGTGGLDGNQNVFQIPINHLTKARNIRFDGFCWRKAPGLSKFDAGQISGAPTCYAGIDWRPSSGVQRQVTVWTDGKVYKETGGNIDAVTLKTGLSVGTYPITLIEGGAIAAGDDRRLFIYGKGIAPQQLLADGSSMSGITNESSDWSATKPGAAVYHDSRIFAFDVDSAPHNFYISSLNDHGNFTAGDARVYSVAPGIGDSIKAAWSWQPEVLFVFKYPRGIWAVDTSDYTGFYMPISLVRDDVGIAGPHAICKVDKDVFFISSNGRLYSLTMLTQGVDPENADLIKNAKLQQFIKDNVDATKIQHTRLIYDELRKELHYIFTSKNGSTNDSALVFDFNVAPKEEVKVAYEDRGEYFNAVWKRIGVDGFGELLAAGSDGYVRRLNSPNRSIDGTVPYMSELQYADTDFDWMPKTYPTYKSMGNLQKRFDMLEIVVLPTGNYDMSCEFIIDGRSVKTVDFNLGAPSDSDFDSAAFDVGIFGGQTVYKHRIPIDAVGNQFSIRLFNSSANEDFAIVNLRVYFKEQGQNYET